MSLGAADDRHGRNPIFAALIAVSLQQSVGTDDPADKRAAKEGRSPATAPWVLPDWPVMTFTETSKAAGIDFVSLCGAPDKPRLVDTLGSGMTWFDYDGDGWLDLFIPNGSTLEAVLGKKEKVTKPDGTTEEVTVKNLATDKLYRNQGDGTFEDVTEKAGLKDDQWGMSAASGDYDNDGDQDLFVCNFGPCFLYRNNGDGTFTDVAKQAGVTVGDNVTPAAAWGDIDADGDLDLYVAAYIEFYPKRPWPPFAKNMRRMKVMFGPQGLLGAPDSLFRNNGDGTFTDVTGESGLRTTEEEHGFTIQMVDLNSDDLLDIFVANDMTPNHHYRAVKPGKFTPCASESGLAVDHNGDEKGCMGVAIADVNDDLIPDIFITNFASQTNDFYVSEGDNLWTEDPTPLEKAHRSGPFVGWGTGFYDFDLDGDEDLVAFNGHVYPQVDTERPRVQDYEERPLFYRRDGPVLFSDAAEAAGPDFNAQRCCRGTAFADYDDDGDIDIALFQMDKPALMLRNDTPRKGRFLRVQIQGTTVNRDGYGARIVVEAGGRRQTRWVLGQGSFISENDSRAHFGFGLAEKADRITVRWPGGKEDVVEGPIALDRTIVIQEGMGKVAELTGEPAADDPAKKRTPQLATRKFLDEQFAQAKKKAAGGG